MKRNRPNDWAMVSKLPTQLEKVKTDPISKELLRQVNELLEGLSYEQDEVEQSFCLLKLFGYNLPDLQNGQVRSLFPVHSLLSHSCLPNLQYIEREGGRNIDLQAVTGIAKGEKLTVRLTPFL